MHHTSSTPEVRPAGRVGEWLRRPRVWGFFLSMAIMAIISVAFFAPDNFEGNVLRQADMQQGAANGREGQLYEEATGEKALWTNSLMSGMPTFQISPSYPSNALFSWIDSAYGLWLPAPSNLLFMMMFGFFILMYVMKARWPIALIGAIAWGFSSYYIIIIGAGHIWKFVTLSYIPPTIAGLVMAYRGRYLAGGAMTALFAMMQLNANHPQMSYYFGFVMAGFVIAYLVEAVREKKLRRWAIATAVTAGAGVLALGANLPSIYNTYEYAKETKRAGSELTPLSSEASEGSNAAKATGGMPYEQIVGWSYGGSETFSLLIPNVKGGATARPERGSMVLMGLDRLADAAPYIGTQQGYILSQFPQYFNDSESTNGPVYVGAVILALFLLGCFTVRGPLKWALIVLTLLSVLLALGRNLPSLTDFMIYHFPLYNKFRAVESILVVAEFTIPLLAMLALKDAMEHPEKLAESRRALFIAFGVPMFICALGILSPSIFGSAITGAESSALSAYPEYYNLVENLRLGMVRSDSLRSFIYLALGLSLLWAYSAGKLKNGMLCGGLGVLVLLDLYTVDKRYVSHDSFCDAFISLSAPFEPDEIDKAISADTTTHFRVMDIPGFQQPDRSYFHSMIGGYHAAKLNRYDDLIRRRMSYALHYGFDPSLRIDSVVELYVPEEQRPLVEAIRADYRTLDMLNARYVIDMETEDDGKTRRPTLVRNENALGNAWFVGSVNYVETPDEEMEALATLDPATEAVAGTSFREILGNPSVSPAPGDTITLTSYTPNRMTYSAKTTSDAVAVFSEIYFPWGWKAQIDGKDVPLARVNYVLRALAVPAGQHTIVMSFDPDSLHYTGATAYACVTLIYLLVAGAIAMPFFRKEK